MNRESQVLGLVIVILSGIGLEFYASDLYTVFYANFSAQYAVANGVMGTGEVIIGLIWLSLHLGIIVGFSFLAMAIVPRPVKRIALLHVLGAGIAITYFQALWYWQLLPSPLLEVWTTLMFQMAGLLYR